MNRFASAALLVLLMAGNAGAQTLSVDIATSNAQLSLGAVTSQNALSGITATDSILRVGATVNRDTDTGSGTSLRALTTGGQGSSTVITESNVISGSQFTGSVVNVGTTVNDRGRTDLPSR